MQRKLHQYLLVFITLVLLLFAFLWYFMFYMSGEMVSNTAIQDTSKIYLKEITEQKGNEVQMNLDGQMAQLNAVARMLEVLSVEDKETLQAFLQEMKRANSFDFIGIIDINGIVVTENSSFPGLSKLNFLAMDEADTHIEFNSSIGNMDLIMVFTPVNTCIEDDWYIAVVAGLATETVSGKISLHDTEASTISEVLERNGRYIIQAPMDNLGSGYNYLSSMKEKAVFDEGSSYEQLEQKMENGEPVFLSYTVDKIRYFSYLDPVEDTDWYVLSTIRYDAVSTGVDSVRTNFTRSSIISITSVLIVFAIAFAVYFFMNRNQERIMVEKIKAEEGNRSKTFFLSQMSHDIRTPMNAIVGFTKLALEEEKDISVIKEYLNKIKTASGHLLMLINEVLEMNRIESGRIELDITACDLVEMVEELKTVVGKQAEEKKLCLITELDMQNPYVYCDKMRLNQILQNLLSNAVKYTKAGEVRFSIQQKKCEDAASAEYEIKVSDTGVGMSPEFLKRAFMPFERAETTTNSRIEGTGLGLSIVKHLIDMMEGEIFVESEINKGSVFTARLKLRLVEEERIEQLKAEKQAEGHKVSQASFVGRRILLVEDNEFNREIAESILTSAGFLVEGAENGQIAIDKIVQAEPGYYDAVLMDVQMPVMGGYEAAKIIRSLGDDRAAVKIIAVTANAFETDRQAAIEAGMDDHVAKPIDIKQLYEVLRKVL